MINDTILVHRSCGADTSTERPRVRAFHNKVKSGCQTCKTRRIKCSEERPVCARCASAGRDCFYASQPRAKVQCRSVSPISPISDVSSTSLELIKPTNLASLDPEESRGFEFFMKVSAPAAATYNVHTKEFFERLIPQVAQSEAAVRHLMVAVAAKQESLSSTTDNALALTRVQVKHYVASLNALSHGTPSGEEVMLLASSLFIILGQMEPVEEQTAQSLFHLTASMRILIERLSQQIPKQSDIIESYIHPIFGRIEIMVGSFIMPSKGLEAILCSVEPQEPILPDEFTDLEQAREYWFAILCWRYNKVARSQPWTADSPAFKAIRALLLRWNGLLMAYAGRAALTSIYEVQRTLAMLSQFRFLFVAMMFSVRYDLHLDDQIRPTFVNLIKPGEVSLTFHVPERALKMIPEMDWEAAPYHDQLGVRLWPLVDALQRTPTVAIQRLAFRM
jgi:hypothetical protein